MKKIILIFIIFTSFPGYSQYDANHEDSVKIKDIIRPRFYFKTELLKTLYLPITNDFKALYVDAQFSIRIINGLHLVNTIYWQKFYINNFAESNITKGYYAESVLEGKINAGLRSSLRLFPFFEEESVLSHAFIELGYNYHDYSGTTDAITYYSSSNVIDTEYHQDIRLRRKGTFANIGISYRFDESQREKRSIVFSPEISIGLYNSNSEVLQNDFTIIKGNPEIDESYPRNKWGMLMRLKIGIGF